MCCTTASAAHAVCIPVCAQWHRTCYVYMWCVCEREKERVCVSASIDFLSLSLSLLQPYCSSLSDLRTLCCLLVRELGGFVSVSFASCGFALVRLLSVYLSSGYISDHGCLLHSMKPV